MKLVLADIKVGGAQSAGSKLKETGTTHWTQPNNATNESGFSALPGGAYYFNNFSGVENMAYFWSASHDVSGDKYSNTSYRLSNSDASIICDQKDYLYSFSVRCVRDEPIKK